MPNQFDSVNDSGGIRQQFATGSQRDTPEGKGQPHLVASVVGRRLAQHCMNGADKYGPRNWELGQPISRLFDSAQRHLWDFQDGDETEDHLAAVVWNVMAIMHTQKKVEEGDLPEELIDFPCVTLEDIKKGQDVWRSAQEHSQPQQPTSTPSIPSQDICMIKPNTLATRLGLTRHHEDCTCPNCMLRHLETD